MAAPGSILAPRLGVVLIWCLCGPGCDGLSGSGPAAPAAKASTGKPDSGFSSAEALLEHIRNFATADDALALLDLAYPRVEAERMTIERLRERERARLAFDRALREAFPDETAVEPPPDLGMQAFAARLDDAIVTRREGRRAYIPYTTPLGKPVELVLIRYRDSWWIATETFAGGENVDDFWYFHHQFYLFRAPRAYSRIAQEVRDGLHASAAEARVAVRQAVRRPEAFMGAVIDEAVGNEGEPARPTDDAG